MDEMKKYTTCTEIEAMTEEEAKTMTDDIEIIKGFSIYVIDFEGYFKYSAIVYGNGRQIRHANRYELHFTSYNGDKEKLRALYIKQLKKMLYTEKELLKPVKDYDDYEKKRHFISNYYPLQFDYISIFFIGSDEERAALQEKTKNMFYSAAALAYFHDAETAEKIDSLYKKLQEEREKSETSYKYMYKAFLHELWNHEYIINWQGDWDVFSCFGRVKYGDNKGPAEYMDELKFNDEQKKAFYDARADYRKKAIKYC